MGTGGIGINEERRSIVYVERIQLRDLNIEIVEVEIARIIDRAEALKSMLSNPGFETSNQPADEAMRLVMFGA